jgi:anti-sigma B factor antagonist
MYDVEPYLKKINEPGKGLTVTGGVRETDEHTLLLTLVGYIETQGAPLFQDNILALIANCPGITTIVLDMAGLTYLASMGIGALLTVHNKATESGRRLLLFGVSEKIWNVISQLGFGDALERIGNMEELSAETENVPADGFPMDVSCSQCGKKLRVTRPGAYRCPDCKTQFSVEPHADGQTPASIGFL